MKCSVVFALAFAAGTAEAAPVTVSFGSRTDPAWTRVRHGTWKLPRDVTSGQASGKRPLSTLTLEAPGKPAVATVTTIAGNAQLVGLDYAAPRDMATGTSRREALWSVRLAYPASAEPMKALATATAAPSTKPPEIAVTFADGRTLKLTMCAVTEWEPLVASAAGWSSEIGAACRQAKAQAAKPSPAWDLLQKPNSTPEAVTVSTAGSATVAWPACSLDKWVIAKDTATPGNIVEELTLSCGAPSIGSAPKLVVTPGAALRKLP